MSRLKDLFQRTTAAAAAAMNLPVVRAKPRNAFTITNKAGKPGAIWRRIIRHETKTLYRQIGFTWKHGEAVPTMQGYREHRFLHATKGWRTYTHGLPGMNPMRRPANIPSGRWA